MVVASVAHFLRLIRNKFHPQILIEITVPNFFDRFRMVKVLDVRILGKILTAHPKLPVPSRVDEDERIYAKVRMMLFQIQ